MRRQLQEEVRRLVAAVVPHFSAGRARVRLGVNTAIHDDTAAELESFASPLWGLAPLAAGKGDIPHADHWLRGLAAGSDPDHPEYWGEPGDRDQRIVEMAAIGFALALAPERFWDPLTGPERDRLARWLLNALPRETADNNWHFFPVLMRTGGDVTLLAGRQHHAWVRHGAAKYAKFAYSTRFGFSLPNGTLAPEQGAYDSTLALSDDGGTHYRVREEPVDPQTTADTVRSTWRPWADVEVTTWVTAAPPWHVRRHRIRTARALHTSEGAFAVDRDAGVDRSAGTGYARASAPAGLTGVRDLDGVRDGEVIDCLPGTNVLARRTALPTLAGQLRPGELWLRCAVLGAAGPEAEAAWRQPPTTGDGT